MKSIARSNLSEYQIHGLLIDLPKPLTYDPRRIALSFLYGWVEPAWSSEPSSEDLSEDQIFEVIDDNIFEWCESMSNNDGKERLTEVYEYIKDLVEPKSVD